MARPELPIGTWGKIRREEISPHRFRARARFRDYDGKTRDVEAWAETAAAAERALRVKLRDRSLPVSDDINRDMRVTRLAELWLAEIIAEQRITEQTINRYEATVRSLILPALGSLRLWEATVSRLDRFLKIISAEHPGTARGAKVVLTQMFTGARIGEILALRWIDVELGGERARVTFSGTLVFVKGKGLFRQPWTKTDAGYRTVTLPSFAVGVLLARQIAAADNPLDAVFSSRRGTWLSPNNVRRQWRQARADTGLGWVTPHTFRKTVATLIDRETDAKTAAAQLGHTNEEITNTYYIEKATLAPDVSTVLETLGNKLDTI